MLDAAVITSIHICKKCNLHFDEKKIGEEKTMKIAITYHHSGDYDLPDLIAPEAPRIGKFGTMRHDYLRTWHRGIFDGMLLKGTLNAHLEEIDRLANEMMDYLVSQMVKQEGVTEQLKADDHMEWVQRMNCIRSRAEEIVSNELIYS